MWFFRQPNGHSWLWWGVPFAILLMAQPVGHEPSTAAAYLRGMIWIPSPEPRYDQRLSPVPPVAFEPASARKRPASIDPRLGSDIRRFGRHLTRIPLVARPTVPQRGPHVERLVFLGAAGTATLTLFYHKLNASFGQPQHPFRLGSDWHSDHALQLDEFLHFTGSYHLTQAMTAMLRWAGLSSRRATWYGALSVGTVMTALEVVDGTRNGEPASISDFAANLAGVAFAVAKPRVPWLRNLDFSISFSDPESLFKRALLLRYDRVRAWMSYALHDVVRLPVSVAVGYGVEHPFTPRASRRYFLGLGLTLSDVFPNEHPREIGAFDWLGVLRLSASFEL